MNSEQLYFDGAWGNYSAADGVLADADGGLRGVVAPSESKIDKRAEALSEERLAWLQRVTREVRGESSGAEETFDMGYREAIAPFADGGGKRPHQDEMAAPLWARQAAARGMLGEDARQVFRNLDVLGLLDADYYASHAAQLWPVETHCQPFAELAALSLDARRRLAEPLRGCGSLGRHGYFCLSGEASGVGALVVADGERHAAMPEVADIKSRMEASGQACRVLTLAAYAYRWAVRRFLWEEILAEQDIDYAFRVADATQAYAAPMADGGRLLLLESAHGLEAVATLAPERAAGFMESKGGAAARDAAAIWTASVGGAAWPKGKPAPLGAFGMEDADEVSRVMKELRRSGAIVFVSGEMALPMAHALIGEAWKRGIAVSEHAVDGLPQLLISPGPATLQAITRPVLAVYPDKRASIETMLMLLLSARTGWAKGRLVFGVGTARAAMLCPRCSEAVDGELAAAAMADAGAHGRGADWSKARTRNVKTPCCGSGYAGEAWYGEVWDGRLLQKELDAAMADELADQGVRPDQRIRARLLRDIAEGRVDYLAAGGAAC
ncbi:hypothetical protein [Chromobacterium sp. IIBBL 290-4]|uniref:hypothetical protein n=1 Tax=Chromobacterium sp. IIBBL 290-4 TaxID=2953890 RepID=UPI0020B7438B|nr:hypothetical protein [Chromobacterium sp. IIBBL 290-4]UTH74134.1 hypothetical protein NKT35_21740 [Chromobacterium sp. IIBBL 290-4]